MAEITSGDRSASTVVWWRDERKRGYAAQLVVAIAVIAFAWFLGHNMIENQARLGVPLSLSFLTDPAGFQLSFASLSVTLDSPISRILLVGALNTLLASVVAAILRHTSAIAVQQVFVCMKLEVAESV